MTEKPCDYRYPLSHIARAGRFCGEPRARHNPREINSHPYQYTDAGQLDFGEQGVYRK